MAHIEVDTHAPMPGEYWGPWRDTGKLIYYNGDCFEFWEPVYEPGKGDNVFEYGGELTEDEALSLQFWPRAIRRW